MKIHLVDGTYELFRAFYGAPSRTGAEGREVGATRALVGSLLALVEKEDATHIAIAFDHVIESFRNQLFAGYKTGEGIDPDLFGQFGLAEEAARALGMVCWPMVDFEADDALATAAARFAADPRVEQIRLCSPDKDLMQCVRDERVVVVDRRRGKIYDAAGVEAKMGVPPERIPDLLALVGDAADGIPGIPKWGAKSTAAVLCAYPGLDAIPLDDRSWTIPVRGQAGLRESLASRVDEARLYRTLATLRTDAPISEGIEALEWRGADRPRVVTLSEQLGDPRLPGRIPRYAGGVTQ